MCVCRLLVCAIYSVCWPFYNKCRRVLGSGKRIAFKSEKLKKPMYSSLIARLVSVCTAVVINISSCSAENTGTATKNNSVRAKL